MNSETTVLLVEDDALVLMSTEEMIIDGGFRVEAAMDGQGAFKMLDAKISGYSAVVTDIQLGTGPTGWQVARYARTLNPAIAVVYVSGDSGYEWSMNGVPGSIMLPKPFAQAQLLTAIATLLNAPTMLVASGSQLPS
jgi:CheY-like chemotaxis protein